MIARAFAAIVAGMMRHAAQVVERCCECLLLILLRLMRAASMLQMPAFFDDICQCSDGAMRSAVMRQRGATCRCLSADTARFCAIMPARYDISAADYIFDMHAGEMARGKQRRAHVFARLCHAALRYTPLRAALL